MLPKKHRITDDYDYKRVRRLGETFHTPLFILTIAPAKDPTTLRFGFITSKKLDKRAVVRNRAKRLLREAVRENFDIFKKGVDVVLVAKRDVIGKTSKDVSILLARTLKKALN